MSAVFRVVRVVIALAVACACGTLPACGSMGMKYFADPPAYTSA